MLTTNISAPLKVESRMRPSIGRWFKKVGDAVTRDEPLVEIDTDNVTHEVRAPVTGVLSKILVKDGEFVQPAAILGTIAAT
jgi:pyruvate/2-oxoglutarate dehydrogenase complex dihydrolipoamide acyltransferase (E2) component